VIVRPLGSCGAWEKAGSAHAGNLRRRCQDSRLWLLARRAQAQQCSGCAGSSGALLSCTSKCSRAQLESGSLRCLVLCLLKAPSQHLTLACISHSITICLSSPSTCLQPFFCSNASTHDASTQSAPPRASPLPIHGDSAAAVNIQMSTIRPLNIQVGRLDVNGTGCEKHRWSLITHFASCLTPHPTPGAGGGGGGVG
jgi:hypothetical protein